MDTQSIITDESQYLMQTYRRADIVLARGDGVYLFDTDGRRYLDFMSGIAVAALGHADPDVTAAVAQQAATLTHVSNLFHTIPQVGLARRLATHSFADRVFFTNSGAEAIEGALKFARKWARGRGPGKHEIVAFSGSFHGRTMGALSVTYKAAYREPFAPLVPGVCFAPFNDLDAAAAVISDATCAVLVEPVQGEGGIHAATPAFLRGLRALCDQHGALLIFDEIQCGLGRTGRLWAHEAAGVTPDIMTLAKPLANGLPIGAILLTENVAAAVGPGEHGSTFAGGPVVCRAGEVVFDRVSDPAFLAAVAANGEYLRERLRALASPLVVEVRGAGLLVGVELKTAVAPILAAARQRGLLVINAGDNTLRIAPPLIVTRDHIDAAVAILGECLAEEEKRLTQGR
ncbi:MAG: aspartate aminotransferase family protein [Candidatus Promineofilum sp.]|nr:aspartate aminotransferase family protein [Promineifilum sp.]MCW5863730.1 aspartate aminotransferase family protein [Anaerolineae bacterium]